MKNETIEKALRAFEEASRGGSDTRTCLVAALGEVLPEPPTENQRDIALLKEKIYTEAMKIRWNGSVLHLAKLQDACKKMHLFVDKVEVNVNPIKELIDAAHEEVSHRGINKVGTRLAFAIKAAEKYLEENSKSND